MMMDLEDPSRVVYASTAFTFKRGDYIECGKRSSISALVFKGLFNGSIPIAIKRYRSEEMLTIKEAQRSLEILSEPKNRHPNFICYFGHASDSEFR